jgi:hypothetical protein
MKLYSYTRDMLPTIINRIKKAPEIIHILIGPRQVGKTTAALQILNEWKNHSLYVTADDPIPPGPEWLLMHWHRARSQGQWAI